MAAWSEYFRSYHLPVLSAEQNDVQFIWRDQCNRRVSDRKQARACAGSWNKMEKKVSLLYLAAAQKITHAAHPLCQLVELHVKAGYASTLLAG